MVPAAASISVPPPPLPPPPPPHGIPPVIQSQGTYAAHELAHPTVVTYPHPTAVAATHSIAAYGHPTYPNVGSSERGYAQTRWVCCYYQCDNN